MLESAGERQIVKSLHLKLPHSIWDALEKRQLATGEPIYHIAREALANHLEIEHNTLFQVSTSSALVEGIYRGAVTIGHLREHGDFGLGTFEGLDGEMIACDGDFYQVRSDGTVRIAANEDLSPFAVVTRFQPEESFELAECARLDALLTELDRYRDSANVFYAIRIDGRFSTVHTRAMCRTSEGVPLVVAAAHQPEFSMRDTVGTMAGFWSPQYTKTIEIPGYHLHFITELRDAGGHVLECSGSRLRVQLQQVNELRLALPENEEFLKADLSLDPGADLDSAEKSQPKKRER